MRKLAPIGAIAALLASIAIVSPLTSASGAGGAETLKFSAIYRDGQFHDVDADGSGGESAGDYTVGNFILRHGGKTQGHLEFHCDIATVDPNRNLCQGVAHIVGRGEIVVADVSNENAEKEKVAITGGTGDFGGASGNGKFDFGRNRAHFTFKVK